MATATKKKFGNKTYQKQEKKEKQNKPAKTAQKSSEKEKDMPWGKAVKKEYHSARKRGYDETNENITRFGMKTAVLAGYNDGVTKKKRVYKYQKQMK